VADCTCSRAPSLSQGSAIDDNTAGADGGGVYAISSSTVTLGDGASVSRNTARGNGGGLSLLKTSSLAIAGRVIVSGNAATGSTSVGGGIAASTSTVRLGSAAEIAHNTAAVDGEALALTLYNTERALQRLVPASRCGSRGGSYFFCVSV
jgi:hypothetical protein